MPSYEDACSGCRKSSLTCFKFQNCRQTRRIVNPNPPHPSQIASTKVAGTVRVPSTPPLLLIEFCHLLEGLPRWEYGQSNVWQGNLGQGNHEKPLINTNTPIATRRVCQWQKISNLKSQTNIALIASRKPMVQGPIDEQFEQFVSAVVTVHGTNLPRYLQIAWQAFEISFLVEDPICAPALPSVLIRSRRQWSNSCQRS